MSTRGRIVALPLILVAVTAAAQGVEPLGEDFLVEPGAVGSNGGGHLAALPDGRFLVITNGGEDVETGAGATFFGVQARAFEADGAPASALFQVNAYVTSGQSRGDVAAAEDGSFVVVWQSDGSIGTDDSDYSVQARGFSAVGSPIAWEHQVNQHTHATQAVPAIARDPAGGYVVVWLDSYSPDQLDVRGRPLAADGVPLADEFAVATRPRSAPSAGFGLAIGASGTGFAVWSAYGSSGTDTSATSVQARRWIHGDGFVGEQIQLNSYTSGYQQDASIAAAPDGTFVVTWRDTGLRDIVLRRLAASGEPVGDEVAMGIQAGGASGWVDQVAHVAIDRRGRIVVAASDTALPPSDPDGGRVAARAFDVDLTPLGSVVQLNTFTPDAQHAGEIAFAEGASLASPSEGLAVISPRYIGDDLAMQVRLRRFRLIGPSIFADDFEDGTTHAWDPTP